MTDTDFLRLARLHRHRRGSWKDFWEQNAQAVKDAVPNTYDRAVLIFRLMEIVLQGGSGKPCEPV